MPTTQVAHSLPWFLRQGRFLHAHGLVSPAGLLAMSLLAFVIFASVQSISAADTGAIEGRDLLAAFGTSYWTVGRMLNDELFCSVSPKENIKVNNPPADRAVTSNSKDERSATVVPVKRQLKQEFGFGTPGSSDPYQISRDTKRETQIVTGDLNAALVEWVIQYRISDPTKFLFDVREPRGTLRDVSESVMREVVGDRSVDEVITIGRQEIEAEALTKMQALSTKYATGISIDQVQLKNIIRPSECRRRSTRSTRPNANATRPLRHTIKIYTADLDPIASSAKVLFPHLALSVDLAGASVRPLSGEYRK